MKNLILIVSLLAISIGIRAQSNEFNLLYDSFRGEEGVVHAYIPGVLCRIAGNIAELDKEEKELLHSIRSIKLMIIENPEINRQINLADVMARVKHDKGIVPLLRVRDKKDDVLILAREDDERISELYVVVSGEENVMLRIKGRMDRDLMQSLYNVTGIEQTKYTGEI